MNTLHCGTLLTAVLTIALHLFASTGRCADAYFASARFEIRPATVSDLQRLRALLFETAYGGKPVIDPNPPLPAKDLQKLRALLPKDDASVTLKASQPGTALFDLGVTSADPQLAAKRANELALAVQAALKNAGDKQQIIIWERAEVPKAPSIPRKE